MKNLEYPSIEDIRQLKNKIPQYNDVISIIESEVNNGNIIIDIGDAGMLPDETYIVIRFQKEATKEYDNLKSHGTPYKVLSFSDNDGATSIWFGVKERIH